MLPGQKLIAKIVTFVLFALLILSFAVWGIGDIFRGGGQVRAVAQVGDQLIDVSSFTDEFNRQLNQLSRRFGTQIDGEQAVALGLDRQVLDQLVARSLFDQEAEDLRMLVTDDQVRLRIVRDPAFRDEFGNFSRDRFVQGLRSVGLSEASYVAALKQDVKREQVLGALTNAVETPQVLADAIYALQQERRIARYVLVPKVPLAEVAEPDDGALQEFYEANQAGFMSAEFRAITLVQLRPEDFAQEMSISEEDLAAEFEARKDEFAVPEKRSLEQIVFPDQASARKALESFAPDKSFAELADGVEGARHVDLGSITQDELLPNLAEPAFALTENQPSEPVESPLGWHVLLVTSIEPGQAPDFAAAREQLEQDLKERAAVEGIISMANELDDALGGGLDLDAAASQVGLAARRIEAIDVQGRDPAGDAIEPLPPLPALSPVLRDTPSGETSLLTETDDGGYFILRVDSITPAAPKPLEEVRERAVELWKEGERATGAREKAEGLVERLEGGEDFASLAAAEGLELATTEGLRRDEVSAESSPSRSLPARLFQLKPGDFITAAADDGEVVAELLEIVPPDPSSDTEVVAAVRDSLANGMQGDLLDQFLAALRKEHSVTVNETVLREILSPY